MIRKTVLIAMASLAAFVVRADDTAQKLVHQLAEKMNGYKSYEIRFTAGMEGEFSDVPGHIVVSGNSYYVQANDYELFCDGKQLYTYNRNEDEVTIENPSMNDNALLSNPSRFFKLSDADFTTAYKGAGTFSGKPVERVELTPKTTGAGYQSILLQINPQTGFPVAVGYRTEGVPMVEITINQILPNVEVSPAMFTFDLKTHKGVEVIDFR